MLEGLSLGFFSEDKGAAIRSCLFFCGSTGDAQINLLGETDV